MNNFELHKRAQQMADSNSSYRLARRNLMLEREIEELRREVGQSQQAHGEAVATVSSDNTVAVMTRFGFEPGTELYAASPAPAAVPEGWRAKLVDSHTVAVDRKDPRCGCVFSENSDDVLELVAFRFIRDLLAAPAPAEPDSEA